MFIGIHGGKYSATDVENVERVLFYGGKRKRDIVGSLPWKSPDGM